MVDEVIQSMFESAGKQLPLQVNSKETRAGVDVFVAPCGLFHHKIHAAMLMQMDGSGKMQGLIFLGLFLQPRWE